MKAKLAQLWRKTRRWLPGVLISVVALIVVFRLASWQELEVAFAAIKPVNLVVAVLLTTISLVTRALAWRVLLGKRTSIRKSFLVINEGYFLNNILPLRAGEIGRAIFMGQASELGPFHVLSTIVIERAFDVAMAAGLMLSTLPLALGMTWARPVAIITLALVILGFIALYLIARYNEIVKGWILRLGKRWPFVQKVIIPRIDALLDGLGALTKPGQFLLALFWIALSWGLWVLLYYIMILPMAPHAPIWWAAFGDAVLAMGIAIPSAPSGLGVFEAALVGAFVILGVSPSAALAYAITMHFLQFAQTGIIGFYGLTQEGRSLSSLFSDIKIKRQQEPTP
ncbi:MAG: lysylphosphatidylglycerol synthase transmembrane domain-containing protein [Anaerolineaceae bacterium]|nr:lysylphosphatidylglycerol synthase transmembrane domain-containing protein [Anaerolineaceae bacterium]